MNLISNLFDLKKTPEDSLQLHILYGNYEEVRKLLESGADPNKFDRNNRNALKCAVNTNSIKMAKLLIRFGADVNLLSRSENGSAESVLFMCAHNRHTEMFNYLMFKCNKNTLCFPNKAALIWFISRERLNFIKTYIVFGYDITKRVTVSMAMRSIECFKLFLSLGAEIPDSFPVSEDFELYVVEVRKYLLLKRTERKQLAEQTMKSLRKEVANNMLKFAQEEVLDICIALKSAEIPLYVMKEIVGWLPNYDIFTDFQIVRVLEKIYESTRKINQKLTK